MRTLLVAIVAALVLAGCASYDGRGLAPGSTAAQVEAAMGKPADRVTKPDGSSVLYFSRNPVGRHVYAVTLGPDGAMRGIEQRLTLENINKLVIGTTTSKDVRDLFGPPDQGSVTHFPLIQQDAWEYRWLWFDDERVLWVYFSKDGVLRQFVNAHDFAAEKPSGGQSMP